MHCLKPLVMIMYFILSYYANLVIERLRIVFGILSSNIHMNLMGEIVDVNIKGGMQGHFNLIENPYIKL